MELTLDRSDFLLDPEVVFLNHGSFGACPLEVHNEYQRIQRDLERQPVKFIQRVLPSLMSAARSALADFIGANGDEVVFVTNPTFAVNELARSLKLSEEDELLTCNQEYGACLNAWRFMQQKSGFSIVEQDVTLPVDSEDQIVQQIWAGVTRNTKVIFLSHITSPTALTLPVAEICRRAREQGILSIVDGAHAPGQIPLDVQQVGADFYVATCHKWMCAPKGSAFLYARREVQHLVEPLVVGWGWGDVARKFNSGSDFADHHEWLGTHDPSAYLTVPKAIEFQTKHEWSKVQQRCHALAVRAIEQAAALPNVRRVHDDAFFRQMALLELSGVSDPIALKTALYERFRVEVPIVPWNDKVFVRASFQAYNTEADIDQLVEALRVCNPSSS